MKFYYRKILIFHLIVVSTAFTYDFPFYFSPGLRLGYEWGSGFTLEAKLSIGTAIMGENQEVEEVEFREYPPIDDIQFYNVTIGINALAIPENNDGHRNYWYLEGQYGKIGFITDSVPFSGVTAGIWRYKNKPFYPKLGIFGGFIGWGEIDIRMVENKKLKFDTGVSGSFPLTVEIIGAILTN